MKVKRLHHMLRLYFTPSSKDRAEYVKRKGIASKNQVRSKSLANVLWKSFIEKCEEY
jgi:hypothetical protein